MSRGRSTCLLLLCCWQRPHSSATGASKKTVGTPMLLIPAAFSFCTNAPPPRATIIADPLCSSFSNSRRAARSARRNFCSPEVRKSSATVRPSRCSIRSSRSTNLHPNRSPKARPTLLLPAPMKPTRKRARTDRSPACKRFFFGRRTPDRFCMRTGLLGRPFARIGFRIESIFLSVS